MNKITKQNHLEESLSLYKDIKNVTLVAKVLCNKYKIPYSENERKKISSWVNQKTIENVKEKSKILIYDIETTRMKAHVWWTGKQYIRHDQIIDEPKIISITFKWLNNDKIHTLTWDNTKKCDKKLIKEFLEYYNQADIVIGVNNDNFDNRFVNARALKYNFEINTFLRSLDLQKEAKRIFRLPSYSMSYLGKYLDLKIQKGSHAGISMWQDIQYGTKEKSKLALKEMIKYNIQDVIVTEELYLRMKKYITNVTHLGVLQGENKHTCPNCGNNNISLYKTTITPSGTIQRIMICNNDKIKFKISNTEYLKYQKLR